MCLKVFSENQFGLDRFEPGEAATTGTSTVMPSNEQTVGHSVECRSHARYVVEGDAEVLLADGSLIFRGRILDISLSGCFIATGARLRMAAGTPVEMVFRANGVMLRTTATVRALRAGVGAGFRFDRLNTRLYEELETLIWTLEGTKG